MRITHPFRTLLAIVGALTFGPFAASAASAATATGYELVNPPQPTLKNGKIEVIEVFNYGCIHCADFQPYVTAWHKTLDSSTVQFSYLPAPFNPLFALYTRGYFTATALGVAEKTHQAIFDAIFVAGKRARSIEELADLYASLGVNRDQFIKTADSMVVDAQYRRAEALMRSYQIDGTPTIVVAGKYRITGDTAGGLDKVFPLVDKLVAQLRKEAKAAAK